MSSGNEVSRSAKGYVIVAAIYLLGLLIGALDMGIITPARIIMQADLGVDDSYGVWILTIYTLFYASSIPIMGKMADINGRKPIYLICILLFGLGSFLCGMSQLVGSFWMLIGSRVVQAVGAGGMMPIATAEIGTAFPVEKRGMALGLVGAVFGLGSVFGASAGSLILDIFGQHNWMFIFLINIPVVIFVLVFGILKLPNHRPETSSKLDLIGVVLLTAMILSLMYFLKTVDFFDFLNSIQDVGVYPFLLIFLVLLPVFVFAEKRAKDPIINLDYFKNKDIIITLICSMIAGLILMGSVFLPQFCENAMFMASGSGGYFIIILGVFTGFASPFTGKLIDKFSVKPVLLAGFVLSFAGALFTSFVACEHPSLLNVIISLSILGLGVGFTMGTPLNYMMLQKTSDGESNSAMAMLSLVRSIGTTIAPALMVAFIVHASASLQDDLMEVMPKEVSITPLPYAQELDQKMADLRSDEETSEMLEGLNIPELSSYSTMEVNISESDSDLDVKVSDQIIDEFKNGDITTVVGSCKHMATDIFSQIKPKLIDDAQGGVDSGIATMREKLTEMDDAISGMQNGEGELSSGISGLSGGLGNLQFKISEMDSNIAEMNDAISQLDTALAGLQSGLDGMLAGKEDLERQIADDQEKLSDLDPASPEYEELQQKLGQEMGALEGVKTQIADTQSSYDELKGKRNDLDKARSGMSSAKPQMEAAAAEMSGSLAQMQGALGEMKSGEEELQSARDSLADTIEKLQAVSDAIPASFDEAEENYLKEIDKHSKDIQLVYQKTLNQGFADMFKLVAICSVVGAVLTLLYSEGRKHVYVIED